MVQEISFGTTLRHIDTCSETLDVFAILRKQQDKEKTAFLPRNTSLGRNMCHFPTNSGCFRSGSVRRTSILINGQTTSHTHTHQTKHGNAISNAEILFWPWEHFPPFLPVQPCPKLACTIRRIGVINAH